MNDTTLISAIESNRLVANPLPYPKKVLGKNYLTPLTTLTSQHPSPAPPSDDTSIPSLSSTPIFPAMIPSHQPIAAIPEIPTFSAPSTISTNAYQQQQHPQQQALAGILPPNEKKRPMPHPTFIQPAVVDKELLEAQRKERNRKHAKRSRQRRKSLTANLEQSLKTLKEENSKLREEIYAHVGNRQRVDSMVEEKVSISTDQFIEELKMYKQKAVDGKTHAFLQTLAKNATKCADDFSPITNDDPSVIV